MGTNGLGKSTRVNALVEYLGKDYKEISYTFLKTTKKTPDGVMTTVKNIGRYYPEKKTFIMGSKNKKGVWVGLDNADITTFDDKYEFYKWIQKEYPDLEYFIQEGYFNNRSMRSSPDANRELFKSSHTVIFIYDNVEEFLERCSGRTGKDKTLDWALNSTGWGDNGTCENLYNRYLVEVCDKHTVESYKKDAPKDLLVNIIFNDTFDYIEETVELPKKEIVDEW